MRALIRFLLLCLLPIAGWAQSPLPPCPIDTRAIWHNCFGTYTLNGYKYVGEFKDGMPSGQGTLIFPDGSKYVGEFKDGMPNGQGTDTFANGDRYVGEWRNGLQNGQGIEYRADGTIVNSGQWADGRLEVAPQI